MSYWSRSPQGPKTIQILVIPSVFFIITTCSDPIAENIPHLECTNHKEQASTKVEESSLLGLAFAIPEGAMQDPEEQTTSMVLPSYESCNL